MTRAILLLALAALAVGCAEPEPFYPPADCETDYECEVLGGAQ